MRHTLVLFCLIITICESFAQIPSQSRFTNVGRIGLSINNFGTIGRPTVRSNTQGPPSMAFPRGSGIEHLFEAGIWIGALVDGQVRVSTSSVDAASGYATGAAGFEFVQQSSIRERSKLTSSSNFSSTAISHQDFVFTMTDSFVVIPGTSIPINAHVNPLGAVVNVETYAWNFSFADYFVIINYKITNASRNRWDSVWLGMFNDLIVRNINITRDAGTAFFNKGRNGVDRNWKAIYAYQSTGDDIDYTRSYGAVQFLGIDWRGMFFNENKPDTFISRGFQTPKVNYNFWNFNSPNPPWLTPQNDLDRYERLKTDIDSNLLLGITGPTNGPPANWIQLLSAGPLPSVEPGETFNYTVAYVCAKQREPVTFLPSNSNFIISTPESRKELTDHFKRVRSTYVGEDINEDGRYDPNLDLNNNGVLDRFILPEPPEPPKTRIVAQDSKIEIYWDKTSEYSIDPISRTRDFEGYRIYRTNMGDDLDLNLLDKKFMIAQWDSAGNDIGFNNGFEAVTLAQPKVFDDDTTKYYYKYTIDNVTNGWQYLILVTAFDKGDKNLGVESLESSFTENEFRVFAGTSVNNFNDKERKVGVYPNPYYTTAAWNGSTSRTQKIHFYNLPERAEITIYTANGDLITKLVHNSETYRGQGSRWFDVYSNPDKIVMSGGEHAWDLLTETKTQVSQGIYLFNVKDLKTGKVQSGKIAILK
ncbi:MAG: hypothetical protein ACK4K9_10495 [Bacteroidia bacterium]